MYTCSTTGKKPTCGAFSLDGAYVFVADKFGDVTVASTGSGASALMLGHYCSTVSAMAVSPDGQCLICVPSCSCCCALVLHSMHLRLLVSLRAHMECQ